MDDERYDRGMAVLQELSAGADPQSASFGRLTTALGDIAPDVPRYMVEFAFGDVYSRPGLTRQEQTLITIAALVALGAEPQIELHLNTGYGLGLTTEQLASTLIHLLPYVGFPRVINALGVLKAVADRRGQRS